MMNLKYLRVIYQTRNKNEKLTNKTQNLFKD